MKKVIILFAVVSWLQAAPAWSQTKTGTSDNKPVSLSDVKPTPEMWFYEQAMRQHDDPKASVRRVAEYRADQRQRRLAAMRWFGFSNARPRVNSDPIHSDYSPGWVSNNLGFPSRWSGAGTP